MSRNKHRLVTPAQGTSRPLQARPPQRGGWHGTGRAALAGTRHLMVVRVDLASGHSAQGLSAAPRVAKGRGVWCEQEGST